MRQIEKRQLISSIAIYMISMLITQMIGFGYFQHPNITLFNGLSGWLLSSATFLLVVLWKDLRESRAFTAPAILWIGATSYSLYLTHGIFLHLFDGLPDPLMFTLSMGCTVIGSKLLYEYVERPGVAAGKAVSMKWSVVT